MILVQSQPQVYSTINSALFKVTSDRENILQFKVNVYDADSGLVMFTKKYATLPMVENGTVFNIAPELSSFIDFQLNISGNILEEVSKVLKRYNVEVKEIYRNVDGNMQEGDTLYLNEDFFIWSGNVSRTDFNNFDYERYVSNSGDTLAAFLNKKPVRSATRFTDTQYLYLLSTVAAKVAITLYKRPGNVVGYHEVTGIAQDKAYRLSVSPEVLIATYGADIFTNGGSEFTDEFNIQFGSPVNIGAADYYTVRLLDNAGVTLTETRTFELKKENCLQSFNMIFGNDLGGFDSMVFYNPKQTIGVARKTIDANPYQFDEAGNYTSANAGIYNPEQVIISTEKQSTFSIVSEVLGDAYAYYAKALVESERVYIKLSTGELYPVLVQETDYNINKAKLNTNNSRLTVNFKLSDVNINL